MKAPCAIWSGRTRMNAVGGGSRHGEERREGGRNGRDGLGVGVLVFCLSSVCFFCFSSHLSAFNVLNIHNSSPSSLPPLPPSLLPLAARATQLGKTSRSNLTTSMARPSYSPTLPPSLPPPLPRSLPPAVRATPSGKTSQSSLTTSTAWLSWRGRTR